MPFRDILAGLVARSQETLGALFLDETGETVDLASSGLSPFELRVIGAYLGIYLRQIRRFLAENGLGDSRLIHIERRDLHVLAQPLPDGYCLALIQRRPASVAEGRRHLAAAARALEAELLG